MGERVYWSDLLGERVTSSLQSHVDEVGTTEGGRLVHSWLRNTFEDELDLEWEGYVENGRFDAFDGTCVYEFKTKHPDVFDDRPPYVKDMSQVDKYLESEDFGAEFGILVYINRGDLTEVDEYLYDGYGVIDL